jgi:hypothetical protein
MQFTTRGSSRFGDCDESVSGPPPQSMCIKLRVSPNSKLRADRWVTFTTGPNLMEPSRKVPADDEPVSWHPLPCCHCHELQSAVRT